MDIMIIFGVMIRGLMIGALYSLISMGLTLIWGTLNIFNFAHGAFITLGAYLTWFFFSRLGLDILLAAIITVPILFLLGIVLVKIIIEPLLPRGLMPIIVGTMLFSIFSDNVILNIFGPRWKRLPPFSDALLRFPYVTIHANELLSAIVALVILLTMMVLLKKTKLGMAMRAVVQDKEAAYLMGINIYQIYFLTVCLSVTLAGVGGIFLGSRELISPTLGAWPLTKAFIIVVFGGLGSIKGTLVASFIIAELEVLTALFLGVYWISPVLFIFMMLVLILKPQGLYGAG